MFDRFDHVDEFGELLAQDFLVDGRVEVVLEAGQDAEQVVLVLLDGKAEFASNLVVYKHLDSQKPDRGQLAGQQD